MGADEVTCPRCREIVEPVETGHLRPDPARRLDCIEAALWSVDGWALELVRFARVIVPDRFDDEALA